jgi:transposase
MIGIDPHKRTHTAVAIDTAERVLDERLVRATSNQVPELLEWVKRLDDGDRIWAIESAGGLGYLLAQQLLAAGEHVVDIPARSAAIATERASFGSFLSEPVPNSRTRDASVMGS